MTRLPRSSASCCPPTCSRGTSGCILAAMVLLSENVQECSGIVAALRPNSNPYGALDAARCHLEGKECGGVAGTKRHRGRKRRGVPEGGVLGGFFTNAHRSSVRRGTEPRKGVGTRLGMGLDSGADMGFDLESALGARMGSFVDGYQGFSAGESPVLLSLLNDDHLRLLGETTDTQTTHQIATMAAEMTSSLQSALHLAPLPASAWETTEDMFNAVDGYLSPATKVVESSLEKLGLSSDQAGAVVAALSLLATAAVLAVFVQRFGGESPPLPTEYDLDQLDAYYRRKPLVVALRFVEVSASLASFLLNVLADVLTNNWDKNMAVRAVQMREFTSSNGPAFIKVGQGASIRPDILPAPYLEEMQKLQDRVPEFSSTEARKILERELGVPVGKAFESVESFDRPIAAASLGQVYKARLKGTGETVAVKVQRPKVLATVTRDLFVIRIILDLIGTVSILRDASRSVKSLIDSWAVRFLEEMDYTMEADNADRFANEMAKHKSLGSAIKVPSVYREMTTRYVLVTQWVDGEKASNLEARSPEGRACLATLQATLLNSYLVQLLDNGFLHADPHPGNFLLQDDGTLCVLDFGLMTEVTEEQSYALLEYVIHIIAKDYPATLEDLIILGFISPEVGDDPEKVALVVPLLAKVMEQLSEGGGAQTITIDTVGEEVEELAKNYPISIPAYFGLIIRCFGTLEGLGLSIDPGYSIVKECFPYLCRRLLTEDTPRMRRMLKSFLYGKNGDFLQVDRVDEILEGYRTFTALAAEVSAPGGSGIMSRYGTEPIAAANGGVATTEAFSPASGSGTLGDYAPLQQQRRQGEGTGDTALARQGGGRGRGVPYIDPASDPVVMDALRLLFAKEGNYVQDLVVEELARMTDALGREVNLEVLQVLRRFADGVMEPIPLSNLSFRPSPDGRLNLLLLPIQLPYLMVERIITRVESVLKLSDEDKETLRATERLVDIFRRATVSTSGAKNPLTAGAAERREWQYEDASHEAEGQKRARFPASLIKTIPKLRPRDIAATAKTLAPLAPEMMPGAQVVASKFMRRLAGKTLARIADNVMPEGTAAAEAKDLLADQHLYMATGNMGPGSSPGNGIGGGNENFPRKIVG
ncbi:unnamed protein product [Ectocarpus sp. 12 AP-2014]